MNVATEMNTHAVFKNLINHGFTEQQAEGITEAVSTAVPSSAVIKEQFNAQDRELSTLKTGVDSTKKDIHDIKTDIVEMKRDIGETKTEIAVMKLEISQIKDAMATKSDLNELRVELKSEFKDGLAELKIDMLKWMLPFLMTIIIGIFVPLFLK